MTHAEVENVFFARFSEDEELLEAIASIARQNDLDSGFFFLIGTLKKAVLGFYKDGRYLPIEKAGPLEIASCMGNISTKEKSDLVVHGHIVVSDVNGNAFGGHILPGCLVDVTAELVLVKVEGGILRREFNKQRKLYLLSLKK